VANFNQCCKLNYVIPLHTAYDMKKCQPLANKEYTTTAHSSSVNKIERSHQTAKKKQITEGHVEALNWNTLLIK
jgi:hypothetical protein